MNSEAGAGGRPPARPVILILQPVYADLRQLDLARAMPPYGSRKQTTVGRLAWTGVCGVLVGAAATTLLEEYGLRSFLEDPGAGWFAGLWSISSLAAMLALWFFLLPRLGSLTRGPLIAWLLCSGAAAGILLIALPVAGRTSPQRWKLRITATGEKNPNAHSSEVWLHAVTADGSEIPLSVIQRSGAWEARNGSLLSHDDQPAWLEWSGRSFGPLDITFTSHAWSGIVEIDLNGGLRQVDLFSEVNSVRVLSLTGGQHSGFLRAGNMWFRAAQMLVLGFVLLAGFMFLAGWGRGRRGDPPGPLAAWQYGAACGLVWTVYLFAFWPGCMTPDSIAQWNQLLQMSFRNDHPFTHALLNWLVTRIWLSPAAVAGAQIIALAAVSGWGIASLRRAGLPRWTAVLLTVLLGLSPANGILSITLWKDVPYAITLLAVTVLIFNIVMSEGVLLSRARSWIGLAVCASLLALLRHNGLLTALPLFALLLLVFPRYWRPVVRAGALALLIYAGMTLGMSRLLQVREAHVSPETVLFYHIAAHQAAGTPFTPQEQELIARLHPPGAGIPYTPYSARPIFFGSLDWKAVRERRSDVRRLFWATARRAPQVNLRHTWLGSSFVWRITQPAGSSYDASPVWIERGAVRYVASNHLGLTEQPPSERFAGWLARQATRTDPISKTFIWRTPAWLYLGLAGVFAAALRYRRPAMLLVISPVMLHSLFAALLPVTNNFRYQFGIYLAGMLLSSLLFLCNPTSGKLFEISSEAKDSVANPRP